MTKKGVNPQHEPTTEHPFRPLGPSFSLKEIRPGVVRKNVEWPTELWARIVVAARARTISPSVLLRSVITQWLTDHTIVPTYSPPPMEVSAEAFDVGRRLGSGNAAMNAYFGETSAFKIAEIFKGALDTSADGPLVQAALAPGEKEKT